MEEINYEEGFLKMKKSGFGEIICNKYNKRIKVDKDNINFNFDGDKVKFIILKETDNVIFARIISKTDIKGSEVVGMIHHFYKESVFIYNERFGKSKLIYCANAGDNLKEGDFLKVKIESCKNDKIYGVIIEVYGSFDSNDALTKYLIECFNLPTSFSDKVLKKGEKTMNRYTTDLSKELILRKDLRMMRTFTIDPKGARDLDDAISLIEHEVGFKLFVHIADVSYFIKKDNSIDIETINRSFSVYLPTCVIRMLPPILSENLCSLLPDSDKYAVTTEININKLGNVISYEIYKSVIKSMRKFTYEEVYEILESKNEEEELYDDLVSLKKLSDMLERKRLKLPELRYNNGLELHNSDYSHRMIEEAMILNNIIAAEELHKRGLKYPSRYHPSPDINSSKTILDNLSLFNDSEMLISIDSIQNLFNMEDNDKKLYNLHMTQKLLSKAKYTNESEGHWALNLPLYSHFTSPIRRVPDIISHRLIFGETYEESEMNKILKKCNENEAKYQKIEFFMDDVNRQRYINRNNLLNNVFECFIVDVKNPTITVFIPELFYINYMHVSDFSKERLEFNSETNEFTGVVNIKINQKMKLKLIKVINSMLDLRFTIAE